MPIDANEAVLASKITGPGERATLSATLQDGMKAVTIRVNDVEGVAGFVLPGDHVDVVVSRPGDQNVAMKRMSLCKMPAFSRLTNWPTSALTSPLSPRPSRSKLM